MKELNYSKGQANALVVLRLLIGWHFLYEGLIKLFNPSWTAQGYLMGSTGPFKGFFHMLSGESLIGFIDFMNIAALTVVGLGLILGLWSRWAGYIGIALLAMYYLAHPPFPGLTIKGPAEGSYLFVNKNLIEIFALAVLIKFPTDKYFGLELFFGQKFKKKPSIETIKED